VKGRDLETLLESSIFCAAVSRLNDPFEFAALSELSADVEQQTKYLQAGVACFCRSLTNPLLWAHYANKHAGFVVSYDKEHPLFVGHPTKGNILFDVKYEDVPPSREQYPNLDEFRFEAIRTKPTCWAYEQEVRLFHTPGDSKLKVPPETIKEVVFGTRVALDRKKEIIRAVTGAGLQVRFAQMEYLREGYGVRPNWTTS